MSKRKTDKNTKAQLTHKQFMLKLCRQNGHEIDSYVKDGKEIVFCYQCDSIQKKGAYFFVGMKRYLANNQN